MCKVERIEAAIKSAEGNLKHEGMYLTEEERALIRSKAFGEITREQFLKKAIDLSLKE